MSRRAWARLTASDEASRLVADLADVSARFRAGPRVAAGLWLDGEAAMNRLHELLAAEHYNLGVEAGLERALPHAVLAGRAAGSTGSPRAAIRALARALVDLSDDLPP